MSTPSVNRAPAVTPQVQELKPPRGKQPTPAEAPAVVTVPSDGAAIASQPSAPIPARGVDFQQAAPAESKARQYGRVIGEGVGIAVLGTVGFIVGGGAGPVGAAGGAVVGMLVGDELGSRLGEKVGEAIDWVAGQVKR